MTGNNSLIKFLSMVNWPVALLGAVCIIVGISFINDPTWCTKYDICVDVSDYNIPLATIMTGVGIYAFWLSCSDKNSDSNMIYICKSCGNSYNSKDTHNHKCPKCDIDLEPLDGFYDRHPELKDK